MVDNRLAHSLILDVKGQHWMVGEWWMALRSLMNVNIQRCRTLCLRRAYPRRPLKGRGPRFALRLVALPGEEARLFPLARQRAEHEF